MRYTPENHVEAGFASYFAALLAIPGTLNSEAALVSTDKKYERTYFTDSRHLNVSVERACSPSQRPSLRSR